MLSGEMKTVADTYYAPLPCLHLYEAYKAGTQSFLKVFLQEHKTSKANPWSTLIISPEPNTE